MWERDMSCWPRIRTHGERWTQIRFAKIWTGVHARPSRYCQQKLETSTVEGQNSETFPPHPIFNVDHESQSGVWKTAANQNFENWGLGGNGERCQQCQKSRWLKTYWEGLRILSFYVIPFRYRCTLNAFITLQNFHYSMFQHGLCWFIIRHHHVSKIKFFCVDTWSAYTLVDVYPYSPSRTRVWGIIPPLSRIGRPRDRFEDPSPIFSPRQGSPVG